MRRPSAVLLSCLAALVLVAAAAGPAHAATSSVQLSVTPTSAPIGEYVEIVVQVSGPPNGQVRLEVYDDGDTTCTGTPLQAPTGDVSSGEAIFDIQIPKAGTFEVRAFFDGDATYDASSTACGDDQITGTKRDSVLVNYDIPETARLHARTDFALIVVDDTVGDQVSSGGDLTYDVYGPGDSDCSDAPVATATTGDLEYSYVDFAFDTLGDHQLVVRYSGSDTHAATETTCGDYPFSVVKRRSELSDIVFSEDDPVAVGTPVTASVQLQMDSASGED